MSVPEPRPGLVIRYDFLWSHEAAVGRDSSKDRPTCIVAATDGASKPCYVVLLPITHSPPTGDVVGIEIPAAVKSSLQLDDAPSWIIVSEYNVDEWPNAGLSPLPNKPGVFAFGFIPPALFKAIKVAFLEAARDGKSKSVRR